MEAGTIIGGRYAIRAELGRGGMGVVYEVEHVNTGEHLALKVLTSAASLHEHTVERFKREARASSQIKSEHVVRVTDAGAAPELGGAPFFVMELLNGTDLEAHVTEHGPLAPARLLEVLGQVGAGLSAAHAAGIVHRDLKPENLFLHRRADGVVVAKILDFGISKFSADTTVGLTTTGAFIGTPLYMAPEQASSDLENITPATDIWALGLVTLRLLTGEHLWGAPSMAELMKKVLVAPIPTPSAQWPEAAAMSPALDAWFARSCDRDPAKRWGSVEAQLRALRDALSNEPLALVDTRPIGTPERAAEDSVGSPPRGPRRQLWPILGGFAFAATLLGSVFLGAPRTAPRAAATTVPATSAEPPTLRLEDVPASATVSETARARFKEGMRAYAEGRTARARRLLDEATTQDPAFASAPLQRAYLSFLRSGDLDEAGRTAFRDATIHRSSLSARDVDLLDALAPAFLDPPDFRESSRRLEGFVATHRRDAQGEDALGFELTKAGDKSASDRAFRAELTIEPEAAVAKQLLAQHLVGRGELHEALDLLDDCIRIAPGAVDCMRQKAATFSALGRCTEADSASRQAVMADPGDERNALRRAATAASTGAPSDVVATLLARRRALMRPGSALTAAEGEDDFALGVRAGDFVAALRGLDHAALDNSEVSEVLHRRAFLRASVLWEMGDTVGAANFAHDFARQSPVRLLPDRLDWDETGRMLNFAYAGEKITAAELGADLSRWIRGWRARSSDAAWGGGDGFELWVRAHATPGIPTKEQALAAFAAREDDGGIMLGSGPDPSLFVSMVTAYGALLLAADRLDDAEEQLTIAARACVLVPEVRALHMLGLLYAKKGDNGRACDAFADVAQIWGHARPRSITAEAARVDAKRLDCKAAPVSPAASAIHPGR